MKIVGSAVSMWKFVESPPMSQRSHIANTGRMPSAVRSALAQIAGAGRDGTERPRRPRRADGSSGRPRDDAARFAAGRASVPARRGGTGGGRLPAAATSPELASVEQLFGNYVKPVS